VGEVCIFPGTTQFLKEVAVASMLGYSPVNTSIPSKPGEGHTAGSFVLLKLRKPSTGITGTFWG